MFKAFLIKYAEIGIKGKNRHIFEEALCRQMRRALEQVDGEFSVTREMGRIYVRTEGAFDYDGAVEALKCVFGIAGICPVVILEDTGLEDLAASVVDYMKQVYGEQEKTFKVCARRAKKTYPLSSMELNCELGERILDACPNMKVDVHHPDVYLNVEIRQNIYLYSETISGPGGMPVGTNGQAMLLLSGGIDSPVAGYMIARRGVFPCAAVHQRESETESCGSGKTGCPLQRTDPSPCGKLYGYPVVYLREMSSRGTDDHHAPLYDEACRNVRERRRMPGTDHRRKHRTGGKPDHAQPCGDQ